MEHPAHHLLLQIPKAESDSPQADRDVVPSQSELLAHQPGRDEYAQRHRYQQQRSQQRHHSGGVAERTPGIQDIVEGVGSPSQLPGAEVVLPGLLVEVSEKQKEGQSHRGRYYKQTDRYAVHGAKTATSARVMSIF